MWCASEQAVSATLRWRVDVAFVNGDAISGPGCAAPACKVVPGQLSARAFLDPLCIRHKKTPPALLLCLEPPLPPSPPSHIPDDRLAVLETKQSSQEDGVSRLTRHSRAGIFGRLGRARYCWGSGKAQAIRHRPGTESAQLNSFCARCAGLCRRISISGTAGNPHECSLLLPFVTCTRYLEVQTLSTG